MASRRQTLASAVTCSSLIFELYLDDETRKKLCVVQKMKKIRIIIFY